MRTDATGPFDESGVGPNGLLGFPHTDQLSIPGSGSHFPTRTEMAMPSPTSISNFKKRSFFSSSNLRAARALRSSLLVFMLLSCLGFILFPSHWFLFSVILAMTASCIPLLPGRWTRR